MDEIELKKGLLFEKPFRYTFREKEDDEWILKIVKDYLKKYEKEVPSDNELYEIVNKLRELENHSIKSTKKRETRERISIAYKILKQNLEDVPPYEELAIKFKNLKNTRKNIMFPISFDGRQEGAIRRFTICKNWGLLLLHKVGTGKTISSLAIALNTHKNFHYDKLKEDSDYEQTSPYKIIIVAPPGIFGNFTTDTAEILTVEDKPYLGEDEDKIPNPNCNNSEYETDLENNIFKFFDIKVQLIDYDYTKFVADVNEKKYFDYTNTVVIFDEAHRLLTKNIYNSYEAGLEGSAKHSVLENDFFKYSISSARRVITMTGTPMMTDPSDLLKFGNFLTMKQKIGNTTLANHPYQFSLQKYAPIRHTMKFMRLIIKYWHELRGKVNSIGSFPTVAVETLFPTMRANWTQNILVMGTAGLSGTIASMLSTGLTLGFVTGLFTLYIRKSLASQYIDALDKGTEAIMSDQIHDDNYNFDDVWGGTMVKLLSSSHESTRLTKLTTLGHHFLINEAAQNMWILNEKKKELGWKSKEAKTASEPLFSKNQLTETSADNQGYESNERERERETELLGGKPEESDTILVDDVLSILANVDYTNFIDSPHNNIFSKKKTNSLLNTGDMLGGGAQTDFSNLIFQLGIVANMNKGSDKELNFFDGFLKTLDGNAPQEVKDVLASYEKPRLDQTLSALDMFSKESSNMLKLQNDIQSNPDEYIKKLHDFIGKKKEAAEEERLSDLSYMQRVRGSTRDFIHQFTVGFSVWLFYDIVAKSLGKGLVSLGSQESLFWQRFDDKEKELNITFSKPIYDMNKIARDMSGFTSVWDYSIQPPIELSNKSKGWDKKDAYEEMDIHEKDLDNYNKGLKYISDINNSTFTNEDLTDKQLIVKLKIRNKDSIPLKSFNEGSDKYIELDKINYSSFSGKSDKSPFEGEHAVKDYKEFVKTKHESKSEEYNEDNNNDLQQEGIRSAVPMMMRLGRGFVGLVKGIPAVISRALTDGDVAADVKYDEGNQNNIYKQLINGSKYDDMYIDRKFPKELRVFQLQQFDPSQVKLKHDFLLGLFNDRQKDLFYLNRYGQLGQTYEQLFEIYQKNMKWISNYSPDVELYSTNLSTQGNDYHNKYIFSKRINPNFDEIGIVINDWNGYHEKIWNNNTSMGRKKSLNTWNSFFPLLKGDRFKDMVHSPNNKDWIEATYDGFDFEKSDGVINKSSEFEDRLNYIKENFTILDGKPIIASKPLDTAWHEFITSSLSKYVRDNKLTMLVRPDGQKYFFNTPKKGDRLLIPIDILRYDEDKITEIKEADVMLKENRTVFECGKFRDVLEKIKTINKGTVPVLWNTINGNNLNKATASDLIESINNESSYINVDGTKIQKGEHLFLNHAHNFNDSEHRNKDMRQSDIEKRYSENKYYLPVVYSYTETLGTSLFGCYLTSKKQNYILIHRLQKDLGWLNAPLSFKYESEHFSKRGMDIEVMDEWLQHTWKITLEHHNQRPVYKSDDQQYKFIYTTKEDHGKDLEGWTICTKDMEYKAIWEVNKGPSENPKNCPWGENNTSTSRKRMTNVNIDLKENLKNEDYMHYASSGISWYRIGEKSRMRISAYNKGTLRKPKFCDLLDFNKFRAFDRWNSGNWRQRLDDGAASSGIFEPNSENPICVIIDPTMTEGLNAKYNPALFILEACNNFGDSEQVEGRVLRKYRKAPETTYFKVIYQYLSYHNRTNRDGNIVREKISKDLNNWFKSDGELEWFENPKTGDAYNHKEGPIFSEGIIIGTNFDVESEKLNPNKRIDSFVKEIRDNSGNVIRYLDLTKLREKKIIGNTEMNTKEKILKYTDTFEQFIKVVWYSTNKFESQMNLPINKLLDIYLGDNDLLESLEEKLISDMNSKIGSGKIPIKGNFSDAEYVFETPGFINIKHAYCPYDMFILLINQNLKKNAVLMSTLYYSELKKAERDEIQKNSIFTSSRARWDYMQRKLAPERQEAFLKAALEQGMKRERGTVGLHAAGPGAITSMFVGVANEKEVFEYVHRNGLSLWFSQDEINKQIEGYLKEHKDPDIYYYRDKIKQEKDNMVKLERATSGYSGCDNSENPNECALFSDIFQITKCKTSLEGGGAKDNTIYDLTDSLNRSKGTLDSINNSLDIESNLDKTSIQCDSYEDTIKTVKILNEAKEKASKNPIRNIKDLDKALLNNHYKLVNYENDLLIKSKMADEVFWTLLSDLTNTAINYKTSIFRRYELGDFEKQKYFVNIFYKCYIDKKNYYLTQNKVLPSKRLTNLIEYIQKLLKCLDHDCCMSILHSVLTGDIDLETQRVEDLNCDNYETEEEFFNAVEEFNNRNNDNNNEEYFNALNEIDPNRRGGGINKKSKKIQNKNKNKNSKKKKKYYLRNL